MENRYLKWAGKKYTIIARTYTMGNVAMPEENSRTEFIWGKMDEELWGINGKGKKNKWNLLFFSVVYRYIDDSVNE